MNKRALFRCAALALALGAPLVFAAPQQLAQADPTAAARAAAKVKHPDLAECDAQNCSVSVTASACNPPSITAAPDTVAVIKTHKGVLLVWTVATSGYTFDKKSGIVFKDTAQSQFKCKARAKATEFECTNKNGNAAMTEYAYGITLRDAGGAACKLDPIIINGY